jgi:hypothetical protein
MPRPRWSGHSRYDDPTVEPEYAEPDVDLLPYSDDLEYLERRPDAQLQHAREQLAIDERRGDQAAVVLWRRLLVLLHRIEWASGEGDRRLF